MTTILEKSLVGQKEFPAISVILPTHMQYPQNKIDREHILDVLNQAESQLLKQYSRVKTDQMMDKLRHAFHSIDVMNLSNGLAVYVSPNVEKIIHLPFTVTEKVIVDDSFEIRDLLMSSKLNRNFLVVIISQNGVKTFFGFGAFLMPVVYKDMPDGVKDVTTEHSFPGLDYMDPKAYDEKNVHTYLRFIDDVIERETKGSDMPVMFMGDPKALGYLRNHTHNSKNIIGYVEGNYERADYNEIRTRIEPLLEQNRVAEQSKWIEQLSHAVSANTYAAGISSVWRAASEGRARLLLVEKNYRQSARYGEDAYTILIDGEENNSRNQIADAVDDVIEIVLKKHGDVCFVDDDMLEKYGRIALITRY